MDDDIVDAMVSSLWLLLLLHREVEETVAAETTVDEIFWAVTVSVETEW